MDICSVPMCKNKIFKKNGFKSSYMRSCDIIHNGKCISCKANLCNKHKFRYTYDDDCGGLGEWYYCKNCYDAQIKVDYDVIKGALIFLCLIIIIILISKFFQTS